MSADAESRTAAERIAQAVEQLPGVLEAAVWLESPDRLKALHITAAAQASGPILSNAAARVLRRSGLAFTTDMIRVVFRDGQPADPAHGRQTFRPASDHSGQPGRFLLLHDLTIVRTGSRITCHVAVRRDHDIFEGEAVELDTESGRIRAAARATLAAAERADNSLALGLEGTALLDMFARRYVAASVEAALDRRFAVLAGLVPVDPARSPEEAACLAALRAIDRWIAW